MSHSSKVISICIFIFWGSSFFCQLLAQKISIYPPIQELGTIPDSQPVYTFFQLVNESKSPIEISKIDTTCGCTSAQLGKKVLLPQEFTQLAVTFNPAGKWGFARWEIQVYQKGSSNPIELALTAEVLRDHILSHQNISFGKFLHGKFVEKEIWISPVSFENFRIDQVYLNINGSKEFFRIVQEKTIYDGFFPRPRPAYNIRVSVLKTLPLGKRNGILVIKTNHPKHKKLEIPVTMEAVAGIVSSREKVLLSPGDIKESIVIYHVVEGRSFKITKVHCSLPFLKTSIEEIVPKQYYEIHLQGKVPQDFIHNKTGKITIKTSFPGQAEIKIPLLPSS